MKTRRKLLEAGKRLIEERNFDNVSVDDIVKSCGVARGTFYIYFKNKQDLVQAISRQPFADIENEIEKMDCSIEKRLCYYAKEFTLRIQQHGLKITQQWVKNVIDPEAIPEDKDGKKLEYDLTALQRIICKAVADNELKENIPTDEISILIISQLYGVMTCWCMSNGKLNTEVLLENYCSRQLIPLLAPYLINSNG